MIDETLKFIHRIHSFYFKAVEPIYLIRQHLQPDNFNLIGESGHLYGILHIKTEENIAVIYGNDGLPQKRLTEYELKQMIK